MTSDLKELARRIRRDILELTFRAGNEGSHIGGALSSADILAVLYGKILKHDPENPTDPGRDRFILSKGHAAVGLYAVLYEAGFLTEDELNSFETDFGLLQTHCVKNLEKGIEISSGSLGWGLSVSIGMQLAARQDKRDFYNYVLLGDGECNEGSVWEAAMLAAQLKHERIVAIIDNNHLQLDGDADLILNSRNFAARFKAFGFNVISVDGHDPDALALAFEVAKANRGSPTALIAETVKGKGVSFLENNPASHHMALNKEQYEQALAELEADK